jgi:hypothetical protein
VRRRVLRAEHDKHLIRDCIATLNKTYGCASLGSEFSNAGQKAAVDNIIATCRAVGAPPVDPAAPHLFSKGALSALLDGSALYSSDGGAVTSFSRDLVSWPTGRTDPVPLESLASGPVLKQLEAWQYQMLRPESEARALQKEICPRGPHVDPVLKNSPWRYAEFLADMSSRGMLSWERAMGRQGNLGLFFVKKKSGAQRIIFDTRVANCRFVDPPSTRLPSPSAFASLETEGGPLYVASGDLDVAFYHMQLPRGMEHLFSLPCIDSSYLQKHNMKIFQGWGDGAKELDARILEKVKKADGRTSYGLKAKLDEINSERELKEKKERIDAAESAKEFKSALEIVDKGRKSYVM